ncbi:hypothetical protein JRQ81_011330 [Phrynocephalus forsythii]|uniref:Uncharacterized protein n=1 Tax=Phrynocephalus forsythii TaxID=171643 RepID=A0A9Q1AQY9_9SAUR|nr:hypothetical protein JRQ81_011330 [Phrynocephalus forsythii]
MYDNNLSFTNGKVNSLCWLGFSPPDSHVLLCFMGVAESLGQANLLPASLFSNSNAAPGHFGPRCAALAQPMLVPSPPGGGGGGGGEPEKHFTPRTSPGWVGGIEVRAQHHHHHHPFRRQEHSFPACSHGQPEATAELSQALVRGAAKRLGQPKGAPGGGLSTRKGSLTTAC